MRKYSQFIFLAVSLITSTTSYGQIEIVFLGKTKWLASEICGKQISSNTSYLGKCEPVFKEYIGIEIIAGAAKADPCISTVEYSKLTNEVTEVNLKFPISEASFIEEVLSNRYGHPTKKDGDFRLWEGTGDAFVALDKLWGDRCIYLTTMTAPMIDAENKLKAYQENSDKLIKKNRLTESVKKL